MKARIWDKQYKIWVSNDASFHCFSNWHICPFTGKLVNFVGSIHGTENGTVFFTKDEADDYYMEGAKIIKAPRYVIQQSLEQEDMNGVEIYEGDLLEMELGSQRPTDPPDSFGVYELYRDSDQDISSWMVRVHKKNWFDRWFVTEEESKKLTIDPRCPYLSNTAMPMFGRCWRVIGNIFENPELLKK